jgi:hypothetical protein
VVAHREHEYGNAAPFAELLQDSDPVEVREAKIEHDDFGSAERGFQHSFLAGCGFQDAIAAGFKS